MLKTQNNTLFNKNQNIYEQNKNWISFVKLFQDHAK